LLLHSWFLGIGNIYHAGPAKISTQRQKLPGNSRTEWFLPGARFCRAASE